MVVVGFRKVNSLAVASFEKTTLHPSCDLNPQRATLSMGRILEYPSGQTEVSRVSIIYQQFELMINSD